jgi:hypothetical protein
VKRAISDLGQKVIDATTAIGQATLLTIETLVWMVRPPYRFRLLFQAMEFVGVGSLFIVLLTGVFTGAVFSLQGASAFRMFNAESLVGSTVGISLARELSPVLTGLMVAGRAGSGIATELGTMRVTEQIDALYTMAVNPVQYLIVPAVPRRPHHGARALSASSPWSACSAATSSPSCCSTSTAASSCRKSTGTSTPMTSSAASSKPASSGDPDHGRLLQRLPRERRRPRRRPRDHARRSSSPA